MRRRLGFFCTTRLLLATLLAFSLIAAVTAQDSSPGAGATSADSPADGNGTAGPLRFRRILVPQDRVDQWPRPQGVAYVTVPPERFEELVDVVRSSPRIKNATIASYLSEARYEARLSGNLLVGRALFDIVHPGEGMILVPLDPLGVAIQKAQWVGDPAEPAVLGLDADGHLEVLVEHPGQLELEWTLQAESSLAGKQQFNLDVARCPSSSLQVTLPETARPQLGAAGIIVSSTPTAPGEVTWQMKLAAQRQAVLEILSAEAAHARPPALRQTTEYTLSPRGIELTTRLTVDALDEPLKRIALEMDEGLRIVSAVQGSVQVPWSHNPQESSNRVTLELPSPLQGTRRVITVSALAQLTQGKPQTLPVIQAPELFWQSGEAKVTVSAPLTVTQLTPVECRQLTPLVGEEAQFQLFSPESRIRVAVGHRQRHTELARGTMISFDGNMLRGRAFCELVQNEGRSFSLDAVISPRWIIDSIRSQPPGAVSNMTLAAMASEGAVAGSPQSQHLRIRLAQPLSPERPLTLLIEGRRLDSPVGQKVEITSMRMLDFENVERTEEFVSLTATAPYQFQITGNDRIRPIDFRSLGVEYQRLFVEAPSTVLPLGQHAEPAELTIVRRDPRYRAEIEVTATVNRNSLEERYMMKCIPEATSVDKLLVRLIPPRSATLEWSTPSVAVGGLRPRRLDDAEIQRRQLPSGSEYWEVQLVQPSTEPFDLHATRSVSWTDDSPQQVSLLALPGAATQQGRILVRQTGGLVVQAQPSRLAPSVLEPASAEVTSADVRAFRYDPPRDVNAAGAQLQLLRNPQESMEAVVYLARVQSQYDAHGQCEHVVTYLIENSGRSELKLAWPERGQKRDLETTPDLEINGEKAVLHVEGKQLLVSLPPQERFVNLQLRFVESSPPLELWTQVQMPLPLPDAPVLASQWMLWLPQGYDTTSASPDWQRLPHRSIPWYERLLGPLVRQSGKPVFDPLSEESWSSLWPSQVQNTTTATTQSRRAVEMLGASYSVLEPSAQQWGPLLEQCARRMVQSAGTLLVDRAALERQGIRPSSALPVIRSESDDVLRGWSLLERSGLTFLAHNSAVIVTSQSRAALLHNQLDLSDHPYLALVNGSTATRVTQSALLGGDDDYVEAVRWNKLTPPRWMPGARGLSAVEAPGWNAFLYSGPVDEPPVLDIYNAPTFQALTWLVLILVAGITWFAAGTRPQRLLVAGPALGAVVMLVPDLFVTVGTSAMLGLCLGGAIAVVRPRGGRSVEPREETVTYTHWAPVGTALTLIALFGWWQWEASAADGAAPVIQKVFVPVDEDGNAVGDFFVPSSLYAELDRQAAEVLRQPRYWLLKSAAYRVQMQRDNGVRWNAEVNAEFDLRVFGHRRRIHIPFGAAPVDGRPQQAVLNGRLVDILWDADGKGFSFDVAGSGAYFLQMDLRPMTQLIEGNSGISLHTPRLATATLEIECPDSGLSVQVPSARGEVRRTDNGRRLTAQLGPAGDVNILWQASSSPGAPAYHVDEFYWLDVKPGSAMLKTKLRFRVEQGALRRLQIAFDPGLRWLDAQIHSSVAKAEIKPGNPNLLDVEFNSPMSGEFELSPQFVLTDTSGVGRIRLPRVEPLLARTRKRWLAVSVDDGALNYREESGTPLELEAAATFMSFWGEEPQRPLFAYRLPPGPIDWSLTTTPLPADLAVDQTLAISVGAAQLVVQCEANITTLEGSTLQHQITVSPNLRVTKVSIFEDEKWQPLRWSQVSPNSVTAFLANSAASRQLRLEGWLPIRVPQSLQTPRVRFDGLLTSAQLQLFRRPGVNLDPQPQGPMEPMAEFEIEQTKAELGRFVSGFRRDDGQDPRATIAVSLNSPDVTAQQATRLRYENRRWLVEYTCRVNVQGGLLDVARFTIPPEVGEPIEVGLPASVELVELPGQTNRQLVVRPRTSIEGETTITFKAPLVIPTGEAVAAPDIRLLNNNANRGPAAPGSAPTPPGNGTAPDNSRWLVLPAQLELRPVSWETRGVEAQAELPDILEKDDESSVTYRIISRQYDARLRPVPSETGIAQVWLADICLAWQADGTCQGLACFDIEPAAQHECLLRLPDKFDLVRLTVDGVHASTKPGSGGSWVVPLGTPHLTQRIEVLFRGKLPVSPDRQRELPAPMLLDLPVQHTLWTVYGPPKAGEPLAPAARMLSRSEQEMLRARSAASVIGEMTWEGTLNEMARWYRPWAGRLMAAVKAYQQCLPRAGQPQLQVAELIREQRDIAAGLEASAQLQEFLDQKEPEARSQDLWEWSIQRRDDPLRCAQTEGSGRLTISYENPVWGDSQSRTWAALALVAFAVVLAAVLRRITTWEPLRRWPHLLGVIFGLAWWLWLSPSILGLCFVAISLLAAVLPTFRRPADANVVPLRLHRL